MIKKQFQNVSNDVNSQLREGHLKRNVSGSIAIIRVILVVSVLWLFLSVVMRDEIAIYHSSSTFILLLVPIVLHYYGRHLLARVLFILFSHVILFSASILVGDVASVDLVTVASFGMVFLIFNYTLEFNWMLLCLGICFVDIIAQWGWSFSGFTPIVTFNLQETFLMEILRVIPVLLILVVIMVKSMRAISQGELAIRELISTKEQLSDAEKMASLGQLTAGVAHELNNPINAINGSITGIERKMLSLYELLDEYNHLNHSASKKLSSKKLTDLRNDVESDQTKRLMLEVIEDIKVGSNRIVKIVSGLKKFSRTDDAEFESENLHDGINETIMLLRNIIKPTTVIKTNFDSAMVDLDCFSHEINQVFMNLIINADQAIDGEGEIHISTVNLETQVSISVRDTGIGMTDEVMRKIFTPFYTTKPIGTGTGLGLAISYGIIEKYGGSIEVKSQEGKGSEFKVLLPKDAS